MNLILRQYYIKLCKVHIFIFLISLTFCVEKPRISNTFQDADSADIVQDFLNKYDKIRLISYSHHRDLNTENSEIKIEKDTILLPGIKFIDNVVLNRVNSIKILKILHSHSKECSMADCYNPRHILLFYNKKKIVGYFEFCAECGGSRQSLNMKIPAFCHQKGSKLIKLFKQMKLKNDGEENENYPYF